MAKSTSSRSVLAEGVPLIGVCLGAQLVARAAGAGVGPAKAPEVGWFTVELSEDGAADPVLGALPRSVRAFQWHYYTFELPDGAVALAQNENARQAYRLGDRAWAIQFHAEVERHMLDRWFAEGADELPKPRRGDGGGDGSEPRDLEPPGACALRRISRRGRATRASPPRPAARGRATTRATSRRSSAPRTLPRRAAAPRARSGSPSGSRRSPRRRARRPTSRRTDSASDASSSVVTSTLRAPGIRPGRGSHGATVAPVNSRRPPDVEQDEARLVEPSCELAGRDVGHASEATVSSSAAIDGRSPHVSSQRPIASCPASENPIRSRNRKSHGR